MNAHIDRIALQLEQGRDKTSDWALTLRVLHASFFGGQFFRSDRPQNAAQNPLLDFADNEGSGKPS